MWQELEMALDPHVYIMGDAIIVSSTQIIKLYSQLERNIP